MRWVPSFYRASKIEAMASREEGQIVRVHDLKLVATTQRAHREACHNSRAGSFGQKEKIFLNKGLPETSPSLNTRHGRAFPCLAHQRKTPRQGWGNEERASECEYMTLRPKGCSSFDGLWCVF